MAKIQGTSLKGDKRYMRAVAKVKAPELDKINERALRRVGIRGRNRIQSSYLVGQPLRYRTGELSKSIGITSKKPTEEIRIGSPLPQAVPLHFGWAKHNMPPRPFIFTAIEDELPTMAEVWVEEVGRAVGSV